MSTPNIERANVKTKTCMNRSPTRCFIVISPRDDFKDIFIYCITLYMIRSSCFIMLLLSFMLNFNISKSQFNGLPVYQHFDFYASLSAFWFLYDLILLKTEKIKTNIRFSCFLQLFFAFYQFPLIFLYFIFWYSLKQQFL